MMPPRQYDASGVFIDPMTDPGFKILFGRESSKDVLISLLNTLLEDDLEAPIVDIFYLDKEKKKEGVEERDVIVTIKNMRNMKVMPSAFKSPIMKRVWELSRKENLTPEERKEYDRNEKAYRDLYNQLQYATETSWEKGLNKGLEEGRMKGLEEGLAEGRAEGRAEEKLLIARNLLKIGLDMEQIASSTGLPLSEIRNIQRL